ncbi:MAG: NAD(P)H-dependent oxidoreductase [Neisseriaceae bacterium]|nr:NAD(P)H-dependent oxidoreductase [Neisseriaceae bacterium]
MNILLINGAQSLFGEGGQLNTHLHQLAVRHLSECGHAVQETHIEAGYDMAAEVDKFIWAEAIVFQMAGWWMGLPWKVKQYMDEVYSIGHGRIYASDGRSHLNPEVNYGTGGLLQGRQYMLSTTWNAPLHAFTAPEEFFEGKGVDGVYFAFHKAQQFVGLQALPTFMLNDVVKDNQPEAFAAAHRHHLTQVFGSAH